jgi:KWG Leptospira.
MKLFKTLLIFSMFSFFNIIIYAQDIITRENGDEIQEQLVNPDSVTDRKIINGNFGDTITPVRFNEEKKVGLKDAEGNIIASAKYAHIKEFVEGMAAVNLGGKERVEYQMPPGAGLLYVPILKIFGGKWGFVNIQGEEIIPCQYEAVESFSEGMAAVKLKYKCGFIDKTGAQIIPCKYDDVNNFSEGLAVVYSRNRCGFVNITGQLVVPCKYEIAESFSEGLAAVRSKFQYGFIDITGKEVIPLKYARAKSFSEGLAVVSIRNRYGFVDITGQEVIPLKYETAESFSEGLAVVKLKNKYGFVDKTGQEVIPCKYDYVNSFSGGLAVACIGVEVKVKGNEYYTRTNFSGDGKWGFIDTNGEEVIPLIYNNVEEFKNGKAKVMLEGKTLYINTEGEVLDQ